METPTLRRLMDVPSTRENRSVASSRPRPRVVGRFLFRALLVALPVLAVTGYLWFESAKSERLLVEAESARQADRSALEFHAFIEAHVDALKGIGNFAASAAASLPGEYARFVERAMADTPGFDVIQWYGPTGAPGPLLPSHRPSAPVEMDGAIARDAARKAIASGQPAGTNFFEIAPGEPALTLALPVFRGAHYEGMVIGAVRLREAFRTLYGAELRGFWNMEVRDRANRVAFRAASSPAEASVHSHVAVADVSWKLRLWPTPQFIAALGTGAPQRILALGLLATLVAAAATYLLAEHQSSLAASLRQSNRLAADVAAARRRLSDLVNGIEAVVWESDLAMERFTFVNDYGRKLLGIAERDWAAEPSFWYERVHPDDRDRVRANARNALLPGRTYPEEYRVITAGERILWVREIIAVIDEDGLALGRRGVIVDITARVQAEEALRQSQKLESLGVLAGGIAHDFNNLLTTILGNTEMLGGQLGSAPPAAAAYLDKIERTTRRLADLTRQMLAYSGRGKFTVAELDLNTIIAEMRELLAVSTSKNVEVTYRLDPRVPTLDGDVTQIRQVILNLLTNAAEAIGDQGRGDVAVRTAPFHLSAADAEEHFPGQDLPPGPYAQLEVSDTGCGMSPETLSKIFDPFFTTKFTGRGLGLAALRGIVRGHRGGIRIFSQPGEGTVFTLIFPASTHPQGTRAGAPGRAADVRRPERRRPQALIVDDEEGLRSLMADALREAGFDVIEAADGVQGVAEFRRHAGEIDVVILDLTMPRMNGDEALAQIAALRPDACVILCSGYTREEVDRQFTGRRLAGFIEKPFTPSELIARIRSVLAERRVLNAGAAWPRDERRFSLGVGEASPDGPPDVSSL